MNIVNNNNHTPIKATDQHAEDLCCELVSPLKILTGEPNLNDDDMKQQNTKKKKRKCRGNRKAQHSRRRERRHRQQQIMNNDTNHMDQDLIIIEDDREHSEEDEQEQNHTQNDSLNNQYQIRLENKRKRQVLSKDDMNVNRSFSQLSISQENPKKKMATATRAETITNDQSNNQILQVVNANNQKETDESLPLNSLSSLKPSYLKVPDKIFKQMLSNAIEGGDQIVQYLDTHEKLQFIRQMTEATNNLYYIDLQCHLWQDYFDLGTNEGVWAPRVTKSFAKQHHTCRTYGFPKHTIERRQKTIIRQSQHAINNVQEYLMKLQENTQHWQPFIDPNILSNAINEYVKKGQQRLREEFDYKKKLLECNSNDHHLIAKFYALQPNQEQIHLAKLIWQTTSDELKTKEFKEILRKRISLQRLPSGIDKIINRSIDPVQLLLSNPVINKDQRASIISACSKTITQYKFDLMSINLNAIENIERGYQQTLFSVQDKLSQCCNESIKQAIENRQQAMRQRHEIYLKHKLNTFFDEAPATVSNE